MSAEMDAVDDIPLEIKLKIATAVHDELTHQIHREVIDGFKVFRAGLAVCREALQEQGWRPPAAPIGEATQRAMAGPEIPHNEASVPIITHTSKPPVRYYRDGTEFFPFGRGV